MARGPWENDATTSVLARRTWNNTPRNTLGISFLPLTHRHSVQVLSPRALVKWSTLQWLPHHDVTMILLAKRTNLLTLVYAWQIESIWVNRRNPQVRHCHTRSSRSHSHSIYHTHTQAREIPILVIVTHSPPAHTHTQFVILTLSLSYSQLSLSYSHS